MVKESHFLNQYDKSNFYVYYRRNIRVYLFFIKVLSKKYENLQRLRFDNNLDLSLNTLRYSTTISLFHYGKLYCFDIFDLLKIIKNALYFNNDLFIESQHPKNPYNNKEFTIGNMINIYLYMRSKEMLIPSYLEDFRRSRFDLPKYVQMNEPNIKLNCIKNYCESMTSDEMYGEIIVMLRRYKINAIIHPEFPREKIVEQFKDNITNYLIHCFSHHPLLRLHTKKQNKESIKAFFKKNPSFGRIIYKWNSSSMRAIVEAETKYKYLNYLSESIPDYNYFEDIENFNSVTDDEDDDDNEEEDDEDIEDDEEDDDEEDDDEQEDEEEEDIEDYSWTRSIDETLNIILRRRNNHFVLDVGNAAQNNVN